MAAPRAAAGPAGRAPAPTPALARLAPALLSLLLLAAGPVSVFGKGPRLKISKCDGHEMAIEVPLPDSGSSVYLQHLKSFSELACQPEIVDGVARFRLPLDNVFQCGITRVTNQQTGTRTYWARVVLEAAQGGDQEVLSAKCTVPGPGAAAGADADEADESVNIAPTPTPALAVNRTRRNVLPAGFQEEEVLEVRPVEKTVQAPQLGVEVRQGGQPVTGELNVNPGTPLTMEIFLDKVAAPIYGLLVSHMTVSDTKAQEETIVFNGCSVDPYLFDNFNTVDGDFLSAKFRAFKFPESSFVQFRGTVTVCLGKCRGVECSNGVVGYGRKRRAVASLPPDPNKVFEVALSAFIKVDYENEEDQAMEKALLAARSDAPAAAESGNILGTVPAASSGMEVAREELPGFTVLQSQSQAIILSSMPLLLLTTILLALLRH